MTKEQFRLAKYKKCLAKDKASGESLKDMPEEIVHELDEFVKLFSAMNAS